MFYVRVFAFFAVLSVGMIARAGEWGEDPTANDVVITVGIDVVEAGDLDDDDLDSLEISAPAGNGAGLVIGAGDWTGTNISVNKLTMNGVAAGDIAAIPGPAGNFNGRAVVVINNGKSLRVNTAELDAASFIGVGYDELTDAVEAGTLNVGSLSLSADNAQIWVSSAGTLAATNVYVNAGSLLVDGGMNGGGSGMIDMTDGLMRISANGTVSNYGAITLTGAGTLRIDAGGRLQGATGAVFNSSGTVNVAGTMDSFREVNVFTGGFTVAQGGAVTGGAGSTFSSYGDVNVAGEIGGFNTVDIHEGDFIVSATGAVRSAISQRGGNLVIDDGLADAGISTSGGVLSLNAGAEVNGALNVSGSANVQVNGAATATSLAVSGGSMNLNTGGTLTVGTAGNLGGTWNMNGGEVAFGGAATFSGGTINVQNGGGTITMAGGNNLTISSALNVSDNLSIGMVGGGTFTIGGRLAIDYGENSATPPLITVTGAGTLVNGGVRLTLDADAHTAFNSAGADGLLVLDTDAVNFTGNAGPLTSGTNAANYTYEFKELTPGSGHGLYVTGIDVFGRGEMEANLIKSWNKHPSVDGHARNLFNDSFIDAVIDGYLLVNNDSPVLDDPSARLNAGTLFGIMEREATATGYDALMLYNGSGLAMANEAVLNLDRHLLRRVSDRSGIVRREVIVDELEQPETVNQALAEDVRLYGDPDAVRIWAEGLVYGDSAKGGDGFAGYDYRGRGLMIGADRRENDIWYGATFAYVQGDFTDKAALSGDGQIDNYAALVYAGWQDANGLYVTGTLGYSYGENALRDSRGLGGVAGVNEADFGSHSFMVAAEAGRDFSLGEHLIVTPSAGLAYVTARGGAHEQWFTGAGGAAAQTLDAGKITGSSFSVPLGLAASVDVYGDEDSLLSITGKAGYAYELQNKGARGEISYGGLQGILDPVRAAGRTPGRHTWNLGLSARYLYDDMEFGLGYDYVKRDSYSSHALSLSAGMNF